GTHWIAQPNFNRILTVTSVGPFVGNADGTSAGTSSPAFTGLIDYFFNTSSPIVPEDVADTIAPNITVWYGNSQNFGQLGVPQQWVNILGNVYDESGVISLNYSLNNLSVQTLSIGPNYRLESSGDFNVEINRTDLIDGDNQLVITAADARGNSKTEIVSINYSRNNVWPQNYIINWSKETNIQDAAQIVDGLWIKEANSIRPGIIGYDRMIAIGDMTWNDYEITVPITINTPLDSLYSHGGPNFGIIMRWQGHYDWLNKQPRIAWSPIGALGYYIWVQSVNGYRLQIIGNNMEVIANDISGTQLNVNVPYLFKMRAQTNGTITRYSLKVWQQDMDESTAVTISGNGPSGELKNGSFTLNAHNSDVSFGNVTIRSGPFEDTQPIAGRYNISGHKLNNSDNTGIQGWIITITDGSTTTTNATGYYEFTNLLNGTYTVTEEQKAGWTNVSALSRKITIRGHDENNVNFSNQRIPVIIPVIIEAKVEIKPETLNIARKKVFSIFITLPDKYDEKYIDLSTLKCNGSPALEGKVSDEGSFIAKFNVQALEDTNAAKEVNMKVTGKVLFDNKFYDFEGSDTIRVINKGEEKYEKVEKRDDNEKEKDIKEDTEKEKESKGISKEH
ncbi:MAG: SdrD B-like domain-containing protein, partial [Candidatus Methanoperedens sp.]